MSEIVIVTRVRDQMVLILVSSKNFGHCYKMIL